MLTRVASTPQLATPFLKDCMKDFEFPFALDKATNKPSVTLFFAYASFLIALGVTIYLTVKDVVAGSVASLMLFFGCLLFYRLRRLDNFSIDLDDKSITVNKKMKKVKK